ncbi:killer cell lectin-like receptor 2 [Phodopus roborovskii]|uniref:LOC101841890 protein n=1 Tax=Phodopus roborovskii TaxID=109678 RepID=A0AAV0AB43_PHORO|nr:killer cell lectin-like receptor 2 [Phodopus roborovskii]CAH7424830.1 LOC101841890 [Phodopus roborovskii]
MSDEEITYTTLRFHKSSSGLQNGGRPDETQGPREAGHRGCSVPWYLIAIPLGILCSILLVAIAVLVTYMFQYRQEKHDQEKILNNFYQKYHIMKNDSYLKEQLLNNKSAECDALKDRLDYVNRESKRCYRETKIVLDCTQRIGTGKRVEAHWFCCGIKCYFIMNNKHWNECKQACKNCKLSILKTDDDDDDDELTFLGSQLHPSTYWIGFPSDTKKRNWQQTDAASSKLSLTRLGSVLDTGACPYLSSKGVLYEDCDKIHGCICEKRMGKFPESVCNARSQLAVEFE